jgi:hypothetical protein
VEGEFRKALVAYAIGLPFVLLGVGWPIVKDRLPTQFATSVRFVFLDFRGWLVIALIGSFYVFVPDFIAHPKPPRHISRAAAEQFQDIIAPYGSIQNPAQRGKVIIVRCQTLEAADLLRDIYGPFYNVHWNVHEVMGEAARFYRDGTVYVQGTFPDDIDNGLKALFHDSDIKAHVRQLAKPQKDQMPDIGIDVECNE